MWAVDRRNPVHEYEPWSPRPAKRHPSAWSDLKIARISAAYIERVEDLSRSPVKDVGDQFGFKSSQIRDALYTARWRREILQPPPKKGEAGGRLTYYGQQLLKEADEAKKGRHRRKKESKS